MNYNTLKKEELIERLKESEKALLEANEKLSDYDKVVKKRDEYKAAWEDAKKLADMAVGKQDKIRNDLQERITMCEKEKMIIVEKANQIVLENQKLKESVLDLDFLVDGLKNISNQQYVFSINAATKIQNKHTQEKNDKKEGE